MKKNSIATATRVINRLIGKTIFMTCEGFNPDANGDFLMLRKLRYNPVKTASACNHGINWGIN